MRRMNTGWALACWALLLGTTASAQFLKPRCTPVAPLYCDPYLSTPNLNPNPNPNPIPNPNPMNPNPADPGGNQAFAQANEGGGAANRSFNDNFSGDFGGIYVTRRVQVGTQNVTFTNYTQPIVRTVPVYQDMLVPAGSRYNGILITDNDGPRPQDRVYFGYNYYNDINTSLNTGADRTDMHRQTAGFETTILDGNGSIGLRLPFIQTTGPASQSGAGDLTVLFKYAFYNNRQTGDIASAGLAVTAPTGGGNNFALSDGSTLPTSVLLQPWLGGVRMLGNTGYVQGITSLVIPTDNREPTLFNNSIGLGYYLYNNPEDRLIKTIVPYLEFHVRTPLNNRDPGAPIFVQDQMNLTTGIHFRTLGATISPAIDIPLVSPRPWNIEAMVWINFRF